MDGRRCVIVGDLGLGKSSLLNLLLLLTQVAPDTYQSEEWSALRAKYRLKEAYKLEANQADLVGLEGVHAFADHGKRVIVTNADRCGPGDIAEAESNMAKLAQDLAGYCEGARLGNMSFLMPVNEDPSRTTTPTVVSSQWGS